jgi:hypothetical protein
MTSLTATDAKRFKFFYASTTNPAGIEEIGRATELPSLAACLACLEELSAQRTEGGPRAYFLELLLRRSFRFVSPETGREIDSGASVVLDDRSVIYSFPQAPAIGVAAASLGAGFPLTAIVHFALKIVVSIGDPVWDFHTRHLEMLARIVPTWTPSKVTDSTTILVLGEQNFAHYALNQLPAIPYAMDAARAGTVMLVATHRPLGSVQSLFPEVRWQERLVPEYELHSLNSPGLLFIPLGASRVTADVARRVLDSARLKLDQRACAIVRQSARAWPRLWVSVRTVNRTASNQHALLSALCRRFLDKYKDGHVIIDGFSLPADFDRETVRIYNCTYFYEIMKRDQEAAEAIRSEFQASDAKRVHTAVGLSIADSIVLAGLADFYFCHHGTLQHKIGWFHSVPGMVHAGGMIISYALSNWVASRSELARPPVYLDIAMISDETPEQSEDERIRQLWRGNYRVDVAAAVNLVMDVLAREVRHDDQARRRVRSFLGRKVRQFLRQTVRSI